MTVDLKPSLEARIVKLVPDAVDGDHVTTQFVIAEVDAGNPIIVFDIGKWITPSHVGKRLMLSLMGLVIGNAERIGEEKYEIIGWNDIPNTTILRGDKGEIDDVYSIPDTLNRVLAGRVVAVSSDGLLLNVGCGTVVVDYEPSLEPEPGWFIRVTDVRLELKGTTPELASVTRG